MEGGAHGNDVLVTFDGPLRETSLHLWKVLSSLPKRVANWSAETLEDFKNLPDFRLSLKERLAMGKLVHDAAN